ncbi:MULTISPECIES: alanine--tRNA ligase [Desulfococcus]|uniref:Alanine--tRNA ligase n=1 Tax=Desulfococcus multivorans DSM 2059 TaxID=1121405 RepID=S7TNV0_DESML|nr:alanine--tRNA ligase [Desulfococcus multivorans]AOY57797.1 AlaS: alanyl-tRNA synthetase [Desulfococcus multivorans]AQV00182.1 alanine--tRNA ligase [Desulfococcus multivorans]EPR38882.1 Alanine-tRNA ligase, eukaryota/bacteria [Desulfococcus multivorans DSM 2059]SJZ68119.1 alanyl-tRNA synthetase [Desulfococcus multivorans DSM 2059]
MTGNEIRQKFLDYFQKHHHQIVRSSSLIPQDDPTLLFTNAGMVQFKRTFLGEEKRRYVRAATSQKCVRAGGKHNDLENVGYTARHHTFFEMLGNFSFGDYFKEKAIEFAWDLLTNGYGLPEDKLWVSIYLDDDEAFDLWRTVVGVPEDRIVRFGEKDNFWAMGDTGPCGPCSEIHIDRGAEFGCGPDCSLGCECDRYLEIWNLVFMQFNRDQSGNMTPLPKPSIDTGMGLERIVSVIQNAATNYDIDLIMPIMRKAEGLSGRRLGESAETDVAMKVIADHSRAMAFLIGDGVLPSNEGRGYVLRRIMRRAIRYGRNLHLMRPFLHETAKVVFDIMKPAYPELAKAEAFITNVIRNEEIRFSETLDKGLALLNDTLAEMTEKKQTEVPGNVIFKLYDTFGFPVDIVRDVVRDRNMTLDMATFDRQMAEQREKSRSVVSFSQISDAYKKLSADGIIPEFIGYETTLCDSTILLLVKDGKAIESAGESDTVEVVVKKTPFYGASGGQVGDIGKITGTAFEMTVTDTTKDPTGMIIHKGKVVKGNIHVGDTVSLSVDKAARQATACNHTATHILHAVLREILGDHVKQAGSLVAPDRLRFDFTHFSQVDPETLDRIEARVNDYIRRNATVNIVEMAAEEAFKTGAMALFEEKYGDRVRVISLDAFSKELCGGTHTRLTGDIGCFKIISESSIASGVRRIEAVSGRTAVAVVQKMAAALRDAAALLKDKPDAVVQRIEKTLAENRALEREVEQLKSKMATMSAAGIDDEIREIKGVKVLAKRVAADNPAALRDAADKFKDKLQSGIVVLGGAANDKAMLIVVVTKDLTGRFHAGNIVKETAAVVGGGGGGRPDMAQAGGTRPEKLDEALESVYGIIERT